MHADDLSCAPIPQDRRLRRQIEVEVDGQVAFGAYTLEGDVIAFEHTFVPEDLRGRGLATRLVESGLSMARAEGLSVIPQCPFFADYMRAHPETHDQLAPEGRALV